MKTSKPIDTKIKDYFEKKAGHELSDKELSGIQKNLFHFGKAVYKYQKTLSDKRKQLNEK